MNSENLSRRVAVGVIGGGVLAAPMVARAFDKDAAGAIAPVSADPSRDPAQLLSPLVPGARLARWVVLAIEPLRDGALTVALRPEDSAEHVFHVELLAKDSSALAWRPPAETAHFAVFVRNGGDGWMPTEEEQGLAAMTLAAIVERNERAGDVAGFLTHEGRVARHPELR